MADDAELLRQYAEEHSEEAFRELVDRHLGLVYHAALRLCADAHRAQDVAQAVFNDLARKAGVLSSRPVLSGWLYTSARYAALRAVRTESRRRAREQEAEAMRELVDGGEPATQWDELRPVIDEALQGLAEREREAILLRFFEGRAFAEIGNVLAVSEDAARMRVDRALERLRGILRKNGITSTAAVLEAALSTQTGAAAPAGVAAQVAAAAVVGGPAAIATFITMIKLQIGIIAAIAAAGAAGLVLQHRANSRLRQEVAGLQQLQAENARLREANNRLSGGAAATAGAAAPAAPQPTPRDMGPADPRQVVALASGLTPVKNLGNLGRATARNAFATQLWAARTGDIGLEASAITFGPEARAKLEALVSTLPDAMRAEYDTPEKLMAFLLAGSPHPVGGIDVVSEVDADANDVTLETEWQHVDDPVVHHSEVDLQQGTDGWKMVVPLSLVGRASAYLSRTLAQPAQPSANGK